MSEENNIVNLSAEQAGSNADGQEPAAAEPQTETAEATTATTNESAQETTQDQNQTERVVAEEPVAMPDQKAGLNVYPNPTDGRMTVEFNSNESGKYRLTVISLTGTVVMDKFIDAAEGTNSDNLDLTSIAKGMYILRLNGEGVNEQKRITLQ